MSTAITPACIGPEVARFEDIAGFESQSINALCTLVHKLPRNGSHFRHAIRYAVLQWVGHLMIGSGAVAPARLDLLARTTFADPMPQAL